MCTRNMALQPAMANTMESHTECQQACNDGAWGKVNWSEVE